MAQRKIIVYQTESSKQPFNDWLRKLKDKQFQAEVYVRLKQVRDGNFGDVNVITKGEGVKELRFIKKGPGYRIYFAEINTSKIILLLGGIKRTQDDDIETAKRYWRIYRQVQKGSRK